MAIGGLVIISGGQTGADRAALDWALSRDVSCRGWCPKGRKAEDGPLPESYPLKETPSASYRQRTEWNVRDSEGTVIFTIKRNLTGGSLRTAEFARKLNRAWIHISAGDKRPAESLQIFLRDNAIRELNVAGSRASKEPGIGAFVMSTLEAAFT